jgi:hypothetical protein
LYSFQPPNHRTTAKQGIKDVDEKHGEEKKRRGKIAAERETLFR